LAYTASNSSNKPNEFIGVIKSRHFEYEQMTYDELKWIVRKLNQQQKDANNISILNERYNHLNFVAQKRYEKRKQRRKEQQKRDKETNQSTLTEIFPQNAPEIDSERIVEETQTAAKIVEKSKTRGNSQSPISQSNPRIRRRSSGIVDNIQDWDEYKKNNW
jgi:putative transposase